MWVKIQNSCKFLFDVLWHICPTSATVHLYIDCVSKNDTDVAHCNFDADQPILIIFGRDYTESILSYVIPPLLASVSALPGETWTPEIVTFQSCYIPCLKNEMARREIIIAHWKDTIYGVYVHVSPVKLHWSYSVQHHCRFFWDTVYMLEAFMNHDIITSSVLRSVL